MKLNVYRYLAWPTIWFLLIGYKCRSEKFDCYRVGRKFEVETDHKPLIRFLGEKDLLQLPLRVQRFKKSLMRYDFFHILYRPSDPPGYEDRDMHKCGMVECYVASNMKTILPQNFRECELSQASLEDETCHVLKNLILSEWLVKVSELSPELKRLYQVCDSFTLYGNIFMNKPHLFIPE